MGEPKSALSTLVQQTITCGFSGITITSDGGVEPVWARSGRELFYRNGDQMIAVGITTEPTFSAGKSRLLFEGRREMRAGGGGFGVNYDIAPDGQRFVMIMESEAQEDAPSQINVVLNWFEELKRRVPTGK